ncbi:MAG: hypothetical protein ABIJ05_01500 [Patescibacteria group bacterium]
MLKNKAVIASFTLVVILLGVFIAKGFSPKDIDPELSEEIITETEDLLPNDEVGSPKKINGSCDMIIQASTCVEYYGSYWTNETITLACQEGVVSTKGCPAPNLGGCRIMPGSESDMITWHYDSGGGGYNLENIQYAIQSCNSVPGGVWAEED